MCVTVCVIVIVCVCVCVIYCTHGVLAERPYADLVHRFRKMVEEVMDHMDQADPGTCTYTQAASLVDRKSLSSPSQSSYCPEDHFHSLLLRLLG